MIAVQVDIGEDIKVKALASLAATYHALGRYEEAEEIKVKELTLRQEILGEEHPDIIKSIAELMLS